MSLRDRAAAVAWAREEARRIVSGDYDTEPLGVFNAAQRMEAVLTRWEWLDEEFPPAVGDFVFGWNVSGPESDQSIREAAHELVQDDSGDGPPLAPRYESG